MTVNDIIIQCVDMYDGVTVDEVFRCLGYVIKDINGKFRGLYDTYKAIEGNVFYNNYKYKGIDVTGTIEIAPDVPGTNPSFISGTDTLFETELSVGSKIIVNGNVYTINTIDDDENGTIVENNITEPALSTAYRVDDFNQIVLSGREKKLFKIIVNGVIAKAVETFDRCYEREICYTRKGYNIIEFHHLPDNPTIEIEGLFALEQPQDRDETFNFPFTWDNLLSAGTLYYLAKKRRDKDGIDLYSSTYYQVMRNFSEGQGMSIPQNRSDWNYATQSRNDVVTDN